MEDRVSAGTEISPTLLAGRRAVVTGAASGIGQAIARAFVAAGASVAGLDIAPAAGIVACDVSDEASVEAAFLRVAAEGPIDDVVHAAGIVSLGTVAEMAPADFRRVLDVNLVGSFLVARAAARHLGRGGNLVFLASQGGLKGGAGWSAYCASKAGLLRLADCLTEELAPRGIRVNSLSPGSVDTAMSERIMADLASARGAAPETVRAGYESAIPLRRFARPEEVAAVAVALCSPLMTYVNGANIIVDGGELSR